MASCNPAQAAFHIVFVDADKTRLIDYVNALGGNDRVLKRGGLILVDNVLWKGLVLDAASGGAHESSSGGDDEPSEEEEMLRRNRRARKLANKMHALGYVAEDQYSQKESTAEDAKLNNKLTLDLSRNSGTDKHFFILTLILVFAYPRNSTDSPSINLIQTFCKLTSANINLYRVLIG